MLRNRLRLLSSLASAPEISTDRLIQIISESRKVPIGKITDHFDKHMKQIFSRDSAQVSRAVLLDSAEGKLQIPEKIREQILAGLVNNFETLSRSEVLLVPRLLRRLPATMMASESEDRLFELFVWCVGSEVSAGEVSGLVKDVARLRFKHPCKEEPVVRFFEALRSEALSSKVRLDVLRAAGSTLGRQKLAHPVVRASCLDLLRGVESECLGTIFSVVSKLAVFPEATDVLRSICGKNEFPVSTEALVDGLLGLASMVVSPHVESVFLPKFVSAVVSSEAATNMFLSGFVDLKRVNNNVVKTIAASINPEFVKTSEAIAGWLKLLADSESTLLECESQRLVPQFEGTKDVDAVVSVMSCLLQASEAVQETFFKQHVLPVLGKLGPGHVRVLLSRENPWLNERVAKSASGVSNPESLAVMLVRVNTDAVAERLRLSLKSASTETAIRTWKILSQDGLVYATPALLATPRGRLLKEATAAVFRSVRMAPIPSIKK